MKTKNIYMADKYQVELERISMEDYFPSCFDTFELKNNFLGKSLFYKNGDLMIDLLSGGKQYYPCVENVDLVGNAIGDEGDRFVDEGSCQFVGDKLTKRKRISRRRARKKFYALQEEK